MTSIIYLLYITYNCILYCCTMVYVSSCFFVLYLCCTLIYISCCNQYSLMRKIKYCTLLCVLCKRLVYTNSNLVAIEFSRRREHEPSTSRTFVRFIVLDYKRAGQSRRLVSISQVSLI